jgi:hypothetical protein
MCTANNNFTVEGLVTKYLNYVKEHCQKVNHPITEYGEEGWDPIHADRELQLLIALYIRVAGEQANKAVIESLSEYYKDYNDYYINALTEDELSFLCGHFSAATEYLFSFTEKWRGIDLKEDIVSQVSLGLIKDNISPKKGETVFIANSGHCDIATLFNGCIIYGFTGFSQRIGESWAIGQIRLFAAGIESNLIPGEEANYSHRSYNYQLPDKVTFDYIVINAETIWAYCTSESLDLHSLYKSLNPKGKMFVISMPGMRRDFREMIVKEKAVSSIINYKGQILGLEDRMTNHTVLIIEKSIHEKVEVVSLSTNRYKTIDADTLSASCLLPGYYMVERPSNGIPLSRIATSPSIKEEKSSIFYFMLKGKVQYEKGTDRLFLPDWVLNQSIATLSDLERDFKDANLCNKSLLKISNPSFDKLRYKIRSVNQPCVLLGTDSAPLQNLYVGYFDKVPQNTYARWTRCLVPKNNVDVRYLTALLLLPEVKEQILSICDGDSIDLFIRKLPDLVIVPKHNKTERNMFLANALDNALKSSREELAQQHEHYKKSVRMRKHALTQSLSSIEVMFYVLNKFRQKQNGIISDAEVISRVKGTTVKEAFIFLERNIKEMMPTLEHIADVEYFFNKPEWVDPEKFTEEYIEKNEKGWLNFKPVITWEKGHNLAKTDVKDSTIGNVIIGKGESINMFWFPKDALERVFNNIISNAQAHGFTDNSRHDYHIRFSWHTDEIALFIEIENNGTAISDDIDTSSLLDYGVSSALHEDGHNGIGCNEIDDIMHRFGGSVEIISTPEKEYKVKYVLKFNRSNTFGA